MIWKPNRSELVIWLIVIALLGVSMAREYIATRSVPFTFTVSLNRADWVAPPVGAGPPFRVKTRQVPGSEIIFRPEGLGDYSGSVKIVLRFTDQTHSPVNFDFVTPQGVTQQVYRYFRGSTAADPDPIKTVTRILPVKKGELLVKVHYQNRPIDLAFVEAKGMTLADSPRTLGAQDAKGSLPLGTLLLMVFVGALAFWLLPQRQSVRQWFLVSLSLAFLAMIQFRFTIVLLAMVAIMYLLGKGMSRFGYRNMLGLTILLWLPIGFFLLFKYFSEEINSIFFVVGGLGIALPLGISYFMFRAMHVLMQWYRGANTDLSFREYLAYLLFLPTVMAGPIDTLGNFRKNRWETFDAGECAYGIQRVVVGLFKKVVIVDLLIASYLYGKEGLYATVVADPAAPLGGLLSTLALASLYAYIDFSSYSDIAVGGGRLFGYRLMENFNWPIFRSNLGDFWQSWHASLSNWCRNEVYFPVLIMTRKTGLALFCSMLAMGMWHHLSLNWFAWAVHHSVGLVAVSVFQRSKRRKKLLARPLVRRLLYPVGVAATFLYVALGFSFVSIPSFETAMAVYWRTLTWAFL